MSVENAVIGAIALGAVSESVGFTNFTGSSRNEDDNDSPAGPDLGNLFRFVSESRGQVQDFSAVAQAIAAASQTPVNQGGIRDVVDRNVATPTADDLRITENTSVQDLLDRTTPEPRDTSDTGGSQSLIDLSGDGTPLIDLSGQRTLFNLPSADDIRISDGIGASAKTRSKERSGRIANLVDSVDRDLVESMLNVDIRGGIEAAKKEAESSTPTSSSPSPASRPSSSSSSGPTISTPTSTTTSEPFGKVSVSEPTSSPDLTNAVTVEATDPKDTPDDSGSSSVIRDQIDRNKKTVSDAISGFTGRFGL